MYFNMNLLRTPSRLDCFDGCERAVVVVVVVVVVVCAICVCGSVCVRLCERLVTMSVC